MSSSGKYTLTGVARARMIAERQRKSPVWRLIHIFASLKLALLLLATIAIAIAIATFTESRFDSAVARAWIYKAPWFIAWLGVLCINLFAVTLSRWPWEKKHTGFIITHYGIILLLIGAVVGSKLGFEGNVTLRTDGAPQRRIVTDRSTLQIESPADSYLYLLPFDAKLIHPTENHPRILPIPGTSLKMVIDGSSEHLLQQPALTPLDGKGTGKAVLLEFTSGNLKQTFRVGLGTGEGAPDHHDFFGLANISFLSELPQPRATNSLGTITVLAGEAPKNGVSVSGNGALITLHTPDEVSASFLISEVLGKEIALGTMKVRVKPTAHMDDAGSGPRKITVVLNNNETGEEDVIKDKPWLLLAPSNKADSVTYQLGHAGEVVTGGILKKGDLLPLGWADWKVALLATGSNHGITTIVLPGDENDPSGLPGFHAYLRDPHSENVTSEPRWVVSGEVTPLVLGDSLVRVGYGLELRPIPFSIALTDFQVPRDEGTDTPSDFRATVVFKDSKSGAERSGLIHMNHPASFPGGFLANLTGLNYKFSQAEWNPRDLRETTLQVLYDPGWFFKWTGSLAICIGIATMFYIRPARPSL